MQGAFQNCDPFTAHSRSEQNLPIAKAGVGVFATSRAALNSSVIANQDPRRETHPICQHQTVLLLKPLRLATPGGHVCVDRSPLRHGVPLKSLAGLLHLARPKQNHRPPKRLQALPMLRLYPWRVSTQLYTISAS
jgi:hypothetical protein